MSHPEAKRELKRKFDQDLVCYQKLKVEKEVEVIRNRNSKKEERVERVGMEELPKGKVLRAEEPMVVTPVGQA